MIRMYQKSLLIIISTFVLLTSTACGSSTKVSDNTAPKINVSETMQSPLPAVETPKPSSQPSSSPAVTKQPEPAPVKAEPAISPEKVKEAESLYEQGFALYNEFKYDDAIKLYDKALQSDPKSYKAYNGKGIALCFKGDYKSGMELIKKALEIKPDFAYSNFNMAMAYKLQKDYDNSLLWFNKALSYDPNDAWGYYGISTIYADWNNTEKSLEYLKKAIDLEPAVKDVAKSQAHYAAMRNNPEFVKLTK